MIYWSLLTALTLGTFSTVYKAEDLQHQRYQNDWILPSSSPGPWTPPPLKKGGNGVGRKRPKYVALKKIYVTSSPMRILNELELLSDLRSCNSICPLVTAFRHHDQVVAVLPYYKHQDFRASPTVLRGLRRRINESLGVFPRVGGTSNKAIPTVDVQGTRRSAQSRHHSQRCQANVRSPAMGGHTLSFLNLRRNFLYNVHRQHGVLVDFGLAEVM